MNKLYPKWWKHSKSPVLHRVYDTFVDAKGNFNSAEYRELTLCGDVYEVSTWSESALQARKHPIPDRCSTCQKLEVVLELGE